MRGGGPKKQIFRLKQKSRQVGKQVLTAVNGKVQREKKRREGQKGRRKEASSWLTGRPRGRLEGGPREELGEIGEGDTGTEEDGSRKRKEPSFPMVTKEVQALRKRLARRKMVERSGKAE